MNAVRDLGDFPSDLPTSAEHLTMVFSAESVNLTQRWKNKNLSADFLADYFANFFPGNESNEHMGMSQEEIRSAIGFIANELLENALKFNYDVAWNMSIRIFLYPTSVVMLSINSIDPAKEEKLDASFRELLAGDPAEMYVQRLEKNAEEDTNASGMGLLSMLNDYGAKLGWRFSRSGAKAPLVLTTAVRLGL